MKRPSFQDPYRAVIKRFNRLGVRYVVVGMAGINYYARNPAETFATLDYDIFVEPTLSNVRKAFQGLRALSFSVATQTGMFNPRELKQLVRDQKTLVATTPEGLMVELLLRVSGYPFSELAKDAATFTVRGVPVRVGRLIKLLRSKRLAGRPKDLWFLRRYRYLLEGEKKSSQSSLRPFRPLVCSKNLRCLLAGSVKKAEGKFGEEGKPGGRKGTF